MTPASSPSLPLVVLGCALVFASSTLAQMVPVPMPLPSDNIVANQIVHNQQAAVANQIAANQQLQQLQNQQAAANQIVVNQQRQQQVMAVGNGLGAYPHLGHLVNELDQNEKGLAELEYDQSSLQAKIAKSKAELARHNSIVETLEEKQRFEIGALQGKVRGMKRYIANLEVSKEELRQKLLAANQKSIYGDSHLVSKVEELRGKNQLLQNHNRRLAAKLQQVLAIGGRHPLDLNADGIVDSAELALSAGVIPHPLDLNADGIVDAAELGLSAGALRHPLDFNGDGLVDSAELGLSAATIRHPLDLNGDGLVDSAELGLGLGATAIRHPLDLNADGFVDSTELALNENSAEAQLRLQAAINSGAMNVAGLTAAQRLSLALQSEAPELSAEEKMALANQSLRQQALLTASPSLDYLLRHNQLRQQLAMNAIRNAALL